MINPSSLTTILGEPTFAFASLPAYFFTLTAMLETLTCTIPDVNEVGVIGAIPPAAWPPVIAAAAQLHGVRLDVRRHADSGEIPHYHFDITGEETDLQAVAPKIAALIGKVLDSYKLRVDLPEDR